MWEAALDRVTTLVGRAFVVGSLVPVLLFSGASFVSFIAVFGADRLEPLVKVAKNYPVPLGLAIVVGLMAVGYLLAIVNPVLKRLLEGGYDLWPLAENLKNWKRAKYVRRRKEVQNAGEEARRIAQRCLDWKGRLVDLNKERRAKADVSSGADEDLADIRKKIMTFTNSGRIPTNDELAEIHDELENLYHLNAALEEIEPLHRSFTDFCEDVKELAQARYGRALANLQANYASVGRSADVQATTLGNVMAANWSYAYNRFGIDAAFMWSRLKGSLSETHARSVEDDRTAYDFCVSLVGLSVFHACLWIVIVAIRWPPVRVSLPVWQILVPFAGVLSAMVFYLAAIEAARSFGSNLRSSFDLFRFDLLKALHIKLPTEIMEERKTWEILNALFVYGDSQQSLSYQHPDQPEKETAQHVPEGLIAKFSRLLKS